MDKHKPKYEELIDKILGDVRDESEDLILKQYYLPLLKKELAYMIKEEYK